MNAAFDVGAPVYLMATPYRRGPICGPRDRTAQRLHPTAAVRAVVPRDRTAQRLAEVVISSRAGLDKLSVLTPRAAVVLGSPVVPCDAFQPGFQKT